MINPVRVGAQHGGDAIGVDRRDHAVFGDQAVDVFGRSDVEGGVVDRHVIGRRLLAEAMRDLAGVPFFGSASLASTVSEPHALLTICGWPQHSYLNLYTGFYPAKAKGKLSAWYLGKKTADIKITPGAGVWVNGVRPPSACSTIALSADNAAIALTGMYFYVGACADLPGGCG